MGGQDRFIQNFDAVNFTVINGHQIRGKGGERVKTRSLYDQIIPIIAPTLTKSPRVRVMATYKLRPSYSSYTHITVVADCDEASL